MIFDKHISDISNLMIELYSDYDLIEKDIQIQTTRKEFIGDFTIIIFPLTRFSSKSLSDIATELGEHLKNNLEYIKSFNLIKGFLNLEFQDSFWFDVFEYSFLKDFELNKKTHKNIVIESCSPNTNKPLHLGHLRNIVLGHAMANILVADGNIVHRVQIINDRGIHICKSMLAWLKFGEGKTPIELDVKGDSFVGRYYVLFEKKYQEEVQELLSQGVPKDEIELKSQLLNEAKEMLRNWEAGDLELIKLWEKMNSWVYDGFETTYKKIGVSFDKIYYESDTYLIGKKHVLNGVKSSIFEVSPDNSIWVNLDDYDLDKKLLLRSDGTAVYMTQDVGTAILRYDDFSFDQMIYIVGNEQNHHFNVLFKILLKMGLDWTDNLFHLSYGMVNLPDGKMKSREGTVIDIDDLLEEMHTNARKIILESNKSDIKDIDDLSIIVGDAALKYFILKPDVKKDIMFNPEESIDFNGHTGPFIQYTYARINSILLRAEDYDKTMRLNRDLLQEEKSLIQLILNYPIILHQAADNLNPSILANYLYNLSKEYNHFYQKIPILNSGSVSDTNFRVTLSVKVSVLIYKGMDLLGIKVPKRM